MSEQGSGRSSSGSVTLRRLVAADWPRLREARLAALAEAPYAFSSTLERELSFPEEVWRSRAGSGRTFAAWDDNVIVGLATGVRDDDDNVGWHLVGMWVSPACRGQGVADRLVAAVCELAGQSGAESVTLWVTETNDRARAFYRRLGFTPTGGRQPVRPGEPGTLEEELTLRFG
jgi:ribosomal protein S18 acetylase RimI-like enzyme